MEAPVLDKNKRYSYQDYLSWIDDKRRELINGFVKLMTPAPSRIHQKISMNLLYFFHHFLMGKKCEVYPAPFDVRLPINGKKEDKEIYDVVQPDISVICDHKKLDDRGCLGAPDLIVEILSKATSEKDLKEKFQLYERSGVREYWIADPVYNTIQVFILNSGHKYELRNIYVKGDTLSPSIFPELTITIDDVFDS